MTKTRLFVAAAGLATCFLGTAPARAQAPAGNPPAQPAGPAAPPGTAQPCSVVAAETSPNLPPATSGPVFRCLEFQFHPVNQSVIDAQTYLFHLKTLPSAASRNSWVTYDEAAIRADFWNLWRTNFLENLWVEVIDEPYSNGVVGEHVIYHLEERSRIKAIDYVSTEENGKLKVEISKIESTLKERSMDLRLDSFVDDTAIRKVIGVVRELYAEQGYNDATITTSTAAVAGGPKLIHLTFKVDQGPKVQIAEVLFDGNDAFPDGKLRRQMKENKGKGPFDFFSDGGTYHEAKFAEDAERVAEFYKSSGYAGVQVGAPRTEEIFTSEDGKRRLIRLYVPIDEGPKYTIGKFEITGESKLNLDAVRALFKIQEGEVYSSKKIRKGLEKAKEAFGAYGFMQWQYDPQLSPRGIDPNTGRPIGPGDPPPIMDISIKMDEGKQFYVNRITFTGNTTTHDAVIRRELRVAEGGLFNSEALKESVRRLNQLGYFKSLEGKDGEMDVQPTTGMDDKVDIKLKVEEQNRNQLSFGAGVSQFDGFFGQLSFQTSNFLGRGETVGVSLQRGSLAEQYQLSFSEPYLFDRPITVGADVFKRSFDYPQQFTQESTGSNLVFGVPLANYTRAFLGYSYERVHVKNINEAYLDPTVLSNSLYRRDTLLLNQGGRRTVSKLSPSVVFNTVNQPIFPSAGKRLSVGLDIAGVGGNTEYLQSSLEGIWYHPFNTRTSFGLRAQSQFIRPYGATTTLPIFEKLFSGGEYTVRGYDIRSIGPRDPSTGVVIGGNKLLTFNAEYYINIMAQARVVFFYDAGQVRDIGEKFQWREPVNAVIFPPTPLLTDPNISQSLLTTPNSVKTVQIGTASAFKTSTGVEVRFFMPVLNVPFRLISSYNPQRYGVLNNNLQPTPRFTFRFAVGTTF